MNPQVISFKCILRNKTGQLISTTVTRDVLTTAAGNQEILPGLSKGLANSKKGEKRNIQLPAAEAYGLYDPKKVVLIPKKKISKPVQVGELITLIGKSGAIRTYSVLRIHDDMVSVDGNHPLAGQDLIFEIEVLEARSATPQEIADSMDFIEAPLLH